MKGLKLIPLLGLAALLSGCNFIGGGNADAAAPKFATQGDEVSYDVFMREFNKIPERSELYNNEIRLGDRVIKASNADISSSVTKRDGKEINKEETKYVAKGDIQADAKTYVTKSTANTIVTANRSNQTGTYDVKSNQKTETWTQFGVSDSRNVQFIIDAKAKDYRVYNILGSDDTEASVFDDYLKSTISSLAEIFLDEMPDSSSAAKGYKFFLNGDVFTFEYENVQNNDITDGSKKVGSSSTTYKTKGQLDITNAKQAVRLSISEVEEMSFIEDYSYESTRKGDTKVTKNVSYVDYSVDVKNPQLKELDLNKYYFNNN